MIDVGGDVEIVEEIEFLVDEGDAGRDRVRRRSATRRSTPSMRIVPPLGSTTPPRIFISVDLPAPFSPIRPITSPRRHGQADAVERHDAGIGLAIDVGREVARGSGARASILARQRGHATRAAQLPAAGASRRATSCPASAFSSAQKSSTLPCR